jgi:hypothetical protein
VLLRPANAALIQTGESQQPKQGFWRLEDGGDGQQLLIIDVPVRQVIVCIITATALAILQHSKLCCFSVSRQAERVTVQVVFAQFCS